MNIKRRKMKQFSIIIATYNAAETLNACLNSIRSQKAEEVELIVVDGNSADATHEIVQENMDIIDIYIHEKDKGIYDAWNKGVKASCGEWILFIGADDILCPDTISFYKDALAKTDCTKIDYVSAWVNYVDSSGRVFCRLGSAWNWKDFSKAMNVAHVASLHNRQLFDETGLFNLEYKICADYEFLARKENRLKTLFFEKVVAHMRMGGISLSGKAIKETCKIANVHTKRSLFGQIALASEKYMYYYLFLIKIRIWRVFKHAYIFLV